MSSVLLFLLLCLSAHACNARYLCIFVKEAAGKQGHLLLEDVDKAKVHNIQSQLGVQLETGNSSNKFYVNQDGENTTMKQEESKANFLKEEAASKGATSGYIIVLSPNDLQRLAKIKELKRSQTRRLLGSIDTEEAVDSKENNLVEDPVVMDYAQPHRKPPIHNEKP